jgi:hypothetical protein
MGLRQSGWHAVAVAAAFAMVPSLAIIKSQHKSRIKIYEHRCQVKKLKQTDKHVLSQWT